MAQLPSLRPERYRVVAPRRSAGAAAGHAWEQVVLPALARGSQLILSPANTAPLATNRNVVMIYDLAAFVDGGWYSPAYTRWHRALVPRVARRARLVLTASEAVQGELCDRLGVEPSRTAAVPLGVEDRFTPDADPERPRRELGLPHPYVLAVGTDSPRKNLALLDRIAPRLAEGGLEVVHAGSSRSYMPAGHQRLRSLGYVADADLPGLYAGAAVLAMPSLYEGFGLPCLEAMACGTPVVSSNRAALPEACGTAALLVDPADSSGFADAILVAAGSGPVRDGLIQRGLEHAARHTWAATAERIDSHLAKLL